jgi:hypothetical protein
MKMRSVSGAAYGAVPWDRGRGVTHYRVYPLDRSGHIAGPPTDLNCDSDGTATEQAKRLVDSRAIEVWDGDRLVICLPKNAASSSKIAQTSK